MKKFYLLSLLWSCAYLSAYAQSSTLCNAEFSFTLAGHTVNFKPSANLPAGTQHWWTFGDAATSPDAGPTHTYANAGPYWVTHYIINQATNCRDSFVRPVNITDSITCNIQSNFNWRRDSTDCRKVIFTNLSTPVYVPNAHYTWKFGDGTTSNELNPTHTYARDSVYNVCLVIELSNTCRKEICKQVEMRCSTPPPPACNMNARFEWRRDSAMWNKIWLVNLSQPIQNTWRTYWSYGDGTSSQDFNSYHVYQQPGKYYVCLKVQALNGCTVTYCDSVIVRKPETCDGKAEFGFEAAANNLLEYRFKPKYVNLQWKYSWDFGDGTSSTAVAPVHKFTHAGVYRVCLTVSNGDNCRTTTCKEIRVGFNCDSVKVKFEYKRNPDKPYMLSFYASGNMPVIQQTWTITKISSSAFPPPAPVVLNANNPTYSFRDSGWYNVCVYAITLNNCKRVYCEKIRIEHGENGRIIPGNIPVFPNPASNLIRLEVNVETSTLLQIRVLDGAGNAKMQFVSPARAGNNNLAIPVEKLSSGLYVVEIRYGNQLKLAKFQKS